MARTHELQTSSRVHHIVRHIKSHMKSDTMMIKLKCQHCGDDFNQSDLLHKHITKLHPPVYTTTTEMFSLDLHSMPLHTPSRRPSDVPAPKAVFASAHHSKDMPIWAMTCNPNPSGLPPFDPNTSNANAMDEWLESFWPGYISSTLSTELKQAPKRNDEHSSPSPSPSPSPSKDATIGTQDLSSPLAVIN
ncbi:hypothetical protein BDN70DRAFT_917379 [Pholiota conissans]|uniref:C2H2-type domain-containing protein n=1 Tax=Pholiota conissans TaxID=109636 RepID=A0A9P5ZB15_9AGAR|nr:hypothetical protein BDN70DRAFT_917379 [Pholiota conissans]